MVDLRWSFKVESIISRLTLSLVRVQLTVKTELIWSPHIITIKITFSTSKLQVDTTLDLITLKVQPLSIGFSIGFYGVKRFLPYHQCVFSCGLLEAIVWWTLCCKRCIRMGDRGREYVTLNQLASLQHNRNFCKQIVFSCHHRSPKSQSNLVTIVGRLVSGHGNLRTGHRSSLHLNHVMTSYLDGRFLVSKMNLDWKIFFKRCG